MEDGRYYIDGAEAALTQDTLSFAQRTSQAIAQYEKAATSYMFAGNHLAAGQAQEAAAKLIHGVGDAYVAAIAYAKAADMFRRLPASHKQAVDAWRLSARLLVDEGKLGAAAKQMESIADLETGDLQHVEAAQDYEQAALYYVLDGNDAIGAQLWEKAAFVYKEAGDTEAAKHCFRCAIKHLGPSTPCQFRANQLEQELLLLQIHCDCNAVQAQ